MTVLGIRISPQETRYALVKSAGTGYELINANGESSLIYPADANSPEEKAEWLYQEFERIIRENSSIASVCVKINEFGGKDTKPKRESSYLVGVSLLFFHQNDIPIELKIYQSIGTRSDNVMDYAKVKVGRTIKYWDKRMADAVVVAWSGHPTSIK